MTATKQIPTSHVFSTDESELKEFPVNKILSQRCSIDEDKSKGIIVNEFSTEEDEPECVLNKQRDTKNDTEYEEYSVTYDVPIYFNVLECGRKILNILDLPFEVVCMATPRDEYYKNMLETLIYHNDRHYAPLSSEKLQQAVSRVMEETEEE